MSLIQHGDCLAYCTSDQGTRPIICRWVSRSGVITVFHYLGRNGSLRVDSSGNGSASWGGTRETKPGLLAVFSVLRHCILTENKNVGPESQLWTSWGSGAVCPSVCPLGTTSPSVLPGSVLPSFVSVLKIKMQSSFGGGVVDFRGTFKKMGEKLIVSAFLKPYE